MTVRGKLYYMVALARSGKSTYADRWVRYQDPETENGFRSKDNPRVIVSGDDIRLAMHGSVYQKEAEGLVFATMDVAARAALLRGCDVLLDETATTEMTLLRYLKIDPDATPIFLDTSLEVCEARAVATGQEYLLGPLQRMNAQLKHLRANWEEIFTRTRDYVLGERLTLIP